MSLAEFQVVMLQFQGWSGKQNGELISLIDGRFDVFLTGDKNLRYQQRIETRQIAIIKKVSLLKMAAPPATRPESS